MNNSNLTTNYPQQVIPCKDRLLTLYYRQEWRGFARIWKGLKRMGNHPCLQVSNKYGARFYLNPENYIDSYVIRSGYYESEVLEAILPFLDAVSVFWDIGANFGLHAVTAKLLKPEARVVCIEPSPVMLAQLQANCKLNALEIETVNIALSDSPKFQNLHIVDGNPGMSTLKPWEKAHYSSKMLCWCDTGDNLISNHILPQPTVIKLDVEGSELEVLTGMKHVFQSENLRAVIFEEDSRLLEKKDNPLYKILSEADFTIEALSRNEKTNHNLDNFIAKRN